MKKILLSIVILGLLFFNSNLVSASTKPNFLNTLEYLNVGESVTLYINNPIKDSKVTWKTSDKKIATVTAKGTVTAIKSGEATITCNIVSGKTTYNLKCKIIVVNEKTTYTLTEESKPSAKTQRLSTYNNNTKDWYLLNEIFARCEKAGGGTIVFKKGKFGISRQVFIPSNVTIILEDGAYIKKLSKTGVAKWNAQKAMFILVEPSKSRVEGIHTEYNGVHNVTIIGKGNAVIDLDFMESSIGIVMGHNRDVVIEGITFKNMNTGHFIEMDASLDVIVNNCKFIGSKMSSKINKEAINLDTPDKITGGFNHVWTSYDKTPVKNVTISNCLFEEIDVAIGTHKYSQKKDENGEYTINMVHENIIIRDNQFINIRKCSLTMINWENVLVENNIFDGGGYTLELSNGQISNSGSRAFSATAVTNFGFKYNEIKNMFTVGGAYSISTGTQTASNYYKPVSAYITMENIKDFYNNKCTNLEHPTILLSIGTFEIDMDFINNNLDQFRRVGDRNGEQTYMMNATIPMS